MYYSTDPKSQLEWALPGFYEVNATAPSLTDLIGASSGNANHNQPRFTVLTRTKGATGSKGQKGATGVGQKGQKGSRGVGQKGASGATVIPGNSNHHLMWTGNYVSFNHNGQEMKKTINSNSWGNGYAYTTMKLTNGCSLSFSPKDTSTAFMIGLSTRTDRLVLLVILM